MDQIRKGGQRERTAKSPQWRRPACPSQNSVHVTRFASICVDSRSGNGLPIHPPLHSARSRSGGRRSVGYLWHPTPQIYVETRRPGPAGAFAAEATIWTDSCCSERVRRAFVLPDDPLYATRERGPSRTSCCGKKGGLCCRRPFRRESYVVCAAVGATNYGVPSITEERRTTVTRVWGSKPLTRPET